MSALHPSLFFLLLPDQADLRQRPFVFVPQQQCQEQDQSLQAILCLPVCRVQ